MKKFGYVAVAAIAALLVTLGFTGAAQAYPDVQIDLDASKQVVYGGSNFTATATANVDCAWDLEWDDVTRTGEGDRFVTVYKAPRVSEITKIALDGVCNYTAPAGTAKTAGGLATWHRQITITVLPTASAAASPSNNRADLGNTGGPNWVFLASGLVLLLAGASAVTLARRRAEAELPAQTA
jgi:LPXTG-motif cell wall-anchored protein